MWLFSKKKDISEPVITLIAELKNTKQWDISKYVAGQYSFIHERITLTHPKIHIELIRYSSKNIIITNMNWLTNDEKEVLTKEFIEFLKNKSNELDEAERNRFYNKLTGD